MQRAVRAAEDVLSHYQHVIQALTFITGSKGAFEVRVNGDLIFSKQTMQKRHANPGEVLQLFQKIVGPDVPVYPQ
ncbi:MAG: Rdx family protein [Anaerolinea sp.]|nr:Rdx family protein [Anaerolinea sp.]